MQKNTSQQKTTRGIPKILPKNNKINTAAQKSHRIAIDLFLLMILSYTAHAALTNTPYEIIPKEQTNNILINGQNTTISLYQPQTNYTLITEEEYEAIKAQNKAFTNKITLFGTIIFILYAITQYPRWKQKLTQLSSNTKNKKSVHKTRNQ